ncbi:MULTISPECIES: hypothetical protein [Natrialba]|uniref:Uncharacterized protein n=2 Tax=Natrialba TaxID=63742 RepID=M0B352_NATA1|nr:MULTISPECIES: hypothetical protein [Natrialba]ELY86432.1 hypothetical protein C484_18337 [Natrialba taiwanensis DSM 12281]ELZ04972.1 hypothetical protein C481_03447 [Natrialba asiatica DSM 12278]
MTATTIFGFDRQMVRGVGTAAMFAIVLIYLFESSIEPILGGGLLAVYAVLAIIVLVSVIEDIRQIR